MYIEFIMPATVKVNIPDDYPKDVKKEIIDRAKNATHVSDVMGDFVSEEDGKTYVMDGDEIASMEPVMHPDDYGSPTVLIYGKTGDAMWDNTQQES